MDIGRAEFLRNFGKMKRNVLLSSIRGVLNENVEYDYLPVYWDWSFVTFSKSIKDHIDAISMFTVDHRKSDSYRISSYGYFNGYNL